MIRRSLSSGSSRDGCHISDTTGVRGQDREHTHLSKIISAIVRLPASMIGGQRYGAMFVRARRIGTRKDRGRQHKSNDGEASLSPGIRDSSLAKPIGVRLTGLACDSSCRSTLKMASERPNYGNIRPELQLFLTLRFSSESHFSTVSSSLGKRFPPKNSFSEKVMSFLKLTMDLLTQSEELDDRTNLASAVGDKLACCDDISQLTDAVPAPKNRDQSQKLLPGVIPLQPSRGGSQNVGVPPDNPDNGPAQKRSPK
ncbi:hypothetical protein AAG570_003754 [Ranatra chinensis]|uniref:Uncharacterized protein n=1 Tax=Ranatra chinensis TaxID=642074 RepID=A0ABD0Y5Q1_9HEMI